MDRREQAGRQGEELIVSGAPAKAQPLWWIQYLRGIAALMVVLHHARNPEPWLYNPLEGVNIGALGVDIFFVISGFIMYTAARDEPVFEFYKRRIIRVVPLYWLATLVPVADGLADGDGFWLGAFVRSLLFIPFYNGMYDGEIWPLLVPGWTLNYEMFFYLIFGLAIAVGQPVLLLTMVMGTLVATGYASRFENAALLTYTSPLLLEFVGGVWLGVAFRRFSFRGLAPLFPLGFAALLGGHWLELPRIVEAGLPAMLIVTGALGLEASGLGARSAIGKLVGDASYSIYLSHTLLIPPINWVFASLPLTGLAQFILYVGSVFAIATAGGIVIHWLVEKPLTRALNKKFATARVAPAGQSA